MQILNQFIVVFSKTTITAITEDVDYIDSNYDDVHLWI